jgi:MYXO-CTERM domain-containing protein
MKLLPILAASLFAVPAYADVASCSVSSPSMGGGIALAALVGFFVLSRTRK